MSRLSLISIILVTRNAEKCLQRCLDSIFQQRYGAIQLIVQDGGSTDGTLAILRANADKIACWVSQEDDGIYDAMNKALTQVQGEWVYFIGADDELTPEFSDLAEQLQDSNTIYYGSVWKEEKKYLGRLSAYQHAKTGINHQAMIYPASVFRKYRYDTQYPISADHILNMWCWKDRSYRFEFHDYTIARFSHTGVSSLQEDRAFEKRKPCFILENYGILIGLRFLFKRLKTRVRRLNVY